MSPSIHSTLAAAVLAAAAALFPVEATAQDLFGRSVAVADGEVLVIKPAATRGPAAVYRFRSTGDGWELRQELRSPAATDSGEGLSPSMVWTGGHLLVGSGDPNAGVGAHLFAPTGPTGEGEWSYTEALALRPDEAPAPTGGIDLATIMRIIQPPLRTVAAHAGRGAVAVSGTQLPAVVGVRAIRASDDGWTLGAAIPAPEGLDDPTFGAALAVWSNHLVIGAPGVGRAFSYVWDDQVGNWAFESELTSEPHTGTDGYGAVVAVDDEAALVTAAGSGDVVTFRWRDGTWARDEVLVATVDGTAGFGGALALHGGEAWVGSPSAAERTGAVERFRMEAGGGWSPLGPLDLAGVEPGYGAGAALAVEGDLAVVGAPLADGGRGRAGILARQADGSWSTPVWVAARAALETIVAEEPIACEEGSAAGFACSDVDLLAFLSLETLGASPGESMSDVWGWTDPDTGRDYALVGRTGGASIVDVTDPSTPSLMGTVGANPSGARDLKVYANHLFFTGDGAGDHGLVVFDLTRLRDVSDTPADFEPDAVYDGISSAHNLVIDEEAGFAYPVGASGGGTTCGGGLHMVDIRDPVNPTFAGCFTDTEGLIWQGRTHDAQCTVYRGPDARYQGQQICFVSNETALRIVDVTDKEHPAPLGVASYPGAAYIHQGWLTEDQRYFFLNDELDELVGSSDRTRTLIWDVSDLEDPVLVGDVFGPDAATDHNLFIKGNRMYQANYRAGFRVFDISDPESPVEVGAFDTTPWEGNPPGFTAGAWTAWPYFESGTVVVSSIHEGLFLLRPVRRELIP